MSLFDMATSMASKIMGEGGIEKIIESALSSQDGGLQGIVDKLHQTGLGDAVSSWIGQGQNAQITHDMIEKVVGSEAVHTFAASTGLPVDKILSYVADHLPNIVSKAAAEGTISAPSIAA
jgi:uncharacterized protein YidB (DUF937 family)